MFWLVLIFILVPIAELYVIIKVGEAIGVWWTVALLIADSIIGSMLMRSQGRLAWGRFNDAIAAGRAPAREVFDGALVIFGGAFLLAPGFITDVLGASLLLPPTRALYRRFVVRSVLRRTPAGRAAMFATGRTRRERPPEARPPADVEGTAHEIPSDPPQLP